MERQIVTVPPDLMRMLSVSWDIDERGQSGGITNAGVTKTVFNAFPRWVGTSSLRLRRSNLLRWRALHATAQGRRGIYRLPMIDPLARPVSDYYTSSSGPNGVLFSGGQSFGNGFGFLFQPFALSAQAAAKGAHSVQIDVSSCNDVPPVVGQIMSHDDWPFLVSEVTALGGTLYELTVEMPLRQSIAVGDPVMMRATGRFEALDDQMGQVSYGRDHTATIPITFQEVLKR